MSRFYSISSTTLGSNTELSHSTWTHSPLHLYDSFKGASEYSCDSYEEFAGPSTSPHPQNSQINEWLTGYSTFSHRHTGWFTSSRPTPLIPPRTPCVWGLTSGSTAATQWDQWELCVLHGMSSSPMSIKATLSLKIKLYQRTAENVIYLQLLEDSYNHLVGKHVNPGTHRVAEGDPRSSGDEYSRERQGMDAVVSHG